MIKNRTRLVYLLLGLVWVLIVVWQWIEHRRVVASARAELTNSAKDISTTLGIVMRSQRRFGVISRERLESALNELIRAGNVRAIALLNAAGHVVASAGPAVDLEVGDLQSKGQHWTRTEVAVWNLVDLGTNFMSEPEARQTTIVLSMDQIYPRGSNAPAPMVPRSEEGAPHGETPPITPGMPVQVRSGMPGEVPPGHLVQPWPPPPPGPPTNQPGRPGEGRRGRFPRPFWMSEQEYRELVEKQGVHSIVVVLSTAHLEKSKMRDLWVRIVTALFATAAVFSVGVAWRNQVRASELELRLVRAAELNARLKEMNLAAAGLAHETKNPLNIIRGQAQLISMHTGVPTEVRDAAARVVEQADRVAAQLNEFINFSRPREIRKTAVRLQDVVQEVLRALSLDIEEKRVEVKLGLEVQRIEADEQQLRQVLFNLVLNAIQAVPEYGRIEILSMPASGGKAVLEVRDNGPGVPPQHRDDIFKPYFTTHQKGTGLGLAIVKQIVLAHGWDVEYVPNQPTGAIFRISHIGVVA